MHFGIDIFLAFWPLSTFQTFYILEFPILRFLQFKIDGTNSISQPPLELEHTHVNSTLARNTPSLRFKFIRGNMKKERKVILARGQRYMHLLEMALAIAWC